MESILPEITKWFVYVLIGWAVLVYVIATVHMMGHDSDSNWVTAASAYTCATFLMAAAIHLLFGT